MQRYYPRMSLRDRIATPEGKRRYVRTLFATIADRYDFITVALSYGQDRRWKRRLLALASLRSGMRVLDLATGTGDLACAAATTGARVVGLDITERMIHLARGKAHVAQGFPRPLAPISRELRWTRRSANSANSAKAGSPAIAFLVG